MAATALDNEAVAWYRSMYRIRCFEETVSQLVRDHRVPGFVHLSMGGEASAVGVMAALDDRDVVYTGHRGHGHILARGSDPHPVLAEILGKTTGLSGGVGGSMHLVDPTVGFWGATGVVGGTMPLALGTAWARREGGGVAAVFFGDGASTTGIFHECLNLAAVWNLPVLFCCENNGFAEFTARQEQSTVADVRNFADVFGIETAAVDGTDVAAVARAAASAVRAVRQGRPVFLELEVVRLSGHYEGDLQAYRSDEERKEALARDPVWRWREELLHRREVSSQHLDALEEEVKRQIAEVRERALADPFPVGEEVRPRG